MNKKTKLIIGCILAVLILSLFVLLSLLQKKISPIPAGTVGNTAGNANNGGLFCEYDGTVYFSNPYDGGALYSMSPDETDLKKLNSVNASNISAGGSHLFYYQREASGSSGLGYVRSAHGLYRSDLNGENAACISRDLVFHMQLIDNYLYYLSSADNGAEFYKLKIDKSEKEMLADTGWNFACALPDGTVYYNGTETNHYLCQYNTHSGASSVVWEGNLWYPVYDSGYIYYLDVSSDYRLCRYSLNDDVVEVLTHDRVDCFNLAGGYIYYQKNSAEEPALKRMTLDGKDVEIVAEGNYTHINATSRYVYFSAFDSEMPIYRTPVNGPVSVSTFDAALEAALQHAQK